MLRPKGNLYFNRMSTLRGLSYAPLDELLENFQFGGLNDNDYSEEEKELRMKFLDEIDIIANKYLNPKERCIYFLTVHERKKTADITVILNYNGWRTTQNSIDRMFKILNLYYDYEQIDKDVLKQQIEENFTKQEQKVIDLLEKRLTIQQINKKLGKKFHYTKTHQLIKTIFQTMNDLGGPCKEFHDFLTEIRRFKDSCNFDESEDRVVIFSE